MLDDMLTVPEAAALLGVSPAAVRGLIMRGRLQLFSKQSIRARGPA